MGDCVAFFFAAVRRGTAFNVGLTTALAANGLPGRRFAVLLSVQLSQLACSLASRVCVCTVFDDPVRGELSPLQHSFPAPPPFSLTSSFCATLPRGALAGTRLTLRTPAPRASASSDI